MIHTEELCKKFGQYWAVDGVSLDVLPGQVLAILGQNGAGKTTTVRMLTSILQPTRGSATVAGFDVRTQPDKVRSSVGVLTEQHGLYPRMSAREYLDYYGCLYHLSREERNRRSNYLLDYFGLAEVAQQRTGEYSKGMRQKLALARALLHSPPVLLLDEPTSAMDPESAQLVRREIATLKSSNRAIIICSHNLSEAEMLADRIAIIFQGKIIIEGTLSELKERVLGITEYDVKISGVWSVDHIELPMGVDLVYQKDSFVRFRVSKPEQMNPILVSRLIAANAQVVSMQEVPRSLEQVYLKVMSLVGKTTSIKMNH